MIGAHTVAHAQRHTLMHVMSGDGMPDMSTLFALHHELLTVNLEEFEFQIEIRVAHACHTKPYSMTNWKLSYLKTTWKLIRLLKMGCVYGVCCVLCVRVSVCYNATKSICKEKPIWSLRVAQHFANGYAIFYSTENHFEKRAEMHATDPVHNSTIIVYGIWHVLSFNLILHHIHFSLPLRLLSKTWIFYDLSCLAFSFRGQQTVSLCVCVCVLAYKQDDYHICNSIIIITYIPHSNCFICILT